MGDSLIIYSYSKCSTCKKALRWLKENNLKYELIDIIESPPSKKLISQAILRQERIKSLFNTSGKSYRELGADKVSSMNQKEAILALTNDSKLIKRPFIITSKGDFIIGFNEEKWSDLLLIN